MRIIRIRRRQLARLSFWISLSVISVVVGSLAHAQTSTATPGHFAPFNGNEVTARTDFNGTRWRFTGQPSRGNEIHFDKDGTVRYRFSAENALYSGGGLGTWNVKDGVLYFQINSYSYHSVRLEEKMLRGVRRTPSASKQPNWDVSLYGVEDIETARVEDAEYQRKYENYLATIEKKRGQVLGESPELERLMTRDIEKSGKNDYLTLCDHDQMAFALSYAVSKNVTLGELCYAWSGTRREWKNTILTDGCRGRCRAF